VDSSIQRVSLAHEQVNLIEALTGDQLDLTPASAVFLDVLHAVITGQAHESPAVDNTLQTAAAQHGIALDDGKRAEVLRLMDQLRELDYGRYTRGYRSDQLGPDGVQVVAAQAAK
jgi:hypothetical protein